MLEKLKNKLKSVSDCYDDFYAGIVERCKGNSELTEHILKFITDNPDSNTSDILIDMMIFIGLPYRDGSGQWHRWDKIISEEEAERIAQDEFCED